MRKKKSGRAGTMLVLACCIALGGSGYAIEAQAQDIIVNQGVEISTRAELVKWYFRKNNGVKQKRMWSITYSCWKSNWINC